MPRTLSLILITLILTACTLEAGVERPPTPDRAGTATSAAQAQRLDALERTVAEQATRIAALEGTDPTPLPAPAPNLGYLAYVQGGDIWVRALPDGEARRLTADGRNREPRWSPSGEWLSFRKDGTLWLMRHDGTGARALGNAGDAAWSPAEDRLAYINWERWGLFIIDPEALANTDASGAGRLVYATELPEGQFVIIRGIAWRPGGDGVAFGLSTWSGEQPTASAVWFAGATPDSSAPAIRVDLGDPQTALLPATWGADGEGLLILRDSGHDESVAEELPIYIAPDNTPIELPAPVQAGATFLARSHAGAPLALIFGAGTTTWERKRLTLFDPAGAGPSDLTDDNTVALAPSFAPDGARLAYVAMPTYADLLDRRIWVRDVASGVPQQLTGDPLYRDEFPHWSVDGTQILFLRMTRDGRVSAWMIAATGGTPRRLVDELTPAPDWFANDGAPNWAELISWWPSPQ
jgi:dipeptidyl aminopeptidase/acylaminoacyl peptidase